MSICVLVPAHHACAGDRAPRKCLLCGGETCVPLSSQDTFVRACKAYPRAPPCLSGQHLKKLLAILGIYVVPQQCACNQRAAIMDAWGCDECERRIDEIVGWLREEAGKRGLPFLDVAGRMLVRRAIRNARKAAAAES